MNRKIEVPPTEATTTPSAWPEPYPLTAKIVPEPYPLDALPSSVRAAVAEVHGFVKAPEALVASSALGAISLAVQALYDMKRADKLSGPSGTYFITIADSGERKSTCDTFFSKEIRQYELEQAEIVKPLLKEFEAAIEAWKANREGIKEAIRAAAKAGNDTKALDMRLREMEQEKPEAPRVPKLIYSDATPEALKWSLAKVWPSGGVMTSEGGIVFGAHGMGKESVMRNLSTLNQLWDGAAIQTERRSTESFTVQGARLTIALQVQEATLRAFFDQSGTLARGSGFLARFLVAWPESTQGLRPFTDPPDAWPNLEAFNRRITSILGRPAPIGPDGTLSPSMLAFTPAGKAAWIAFHDRVESELRNGGNLQDVRDVASKIADNAARLAAQFHVFEGVAGDLVGPDSFEAARRVTEWHLHEAKRFFGELALPTALANAARLETWLIDWCHRHNETEVPIKAVQQFGPRGIREKVLIDAAMQELEELWRAQRVCAGRRKYLAVNPALLRAGITNPSPATSATSATNEPATLATPATNQLATPATRATDPPLSSRNSNNSGSSTPAAGTTTPRRARLTLRQRLGSIRRWVRMVWPSFHLGD